jgi:uncharacterized membrane-anchored protein
MNERVRKAIILAGLVLVLAGVNYTIWSRENLLASGEMLLVELAPVDPRSLMQGDYMALNFRVATQVPRAEDSAPSAGKLVVKRDASGVAAFDRVYAGGALGLDERLLDYRVRDRRVRIVTNAWFFEEGQGGRYASARYGELRVLPSGEALLSGMRDADMKPIRP